VKGRLATNCLIPRNGETAGRNKPCITLARKEWWLYLMLVAPKSLRCRAFSTQSLVFTASSVDSLNLLNRSLLTTFHVFLTQ
jgi:hypothetical protein